MPIDLSRIAPEMRLAYPLLFEDFVGEQEEFYRSKATETFVFGANRGGKTHCGAKRAAGFATGFHPLIAIDELECPVPNKGWVCALDRDTGLDVLMPKILHFIPSEMVRKVTRGDVPEILLENGSQIRFKSVAAGREKFQSKDLDWAWFDEEPPEPVYQEVLMRLVDRGGHVWTTMTPLKGKTWVYKLVYLNWKANPDKRREDLRVHSWSIWANTTLKKEFIEKILARIPEHMRPAREHGSFIDLQGLIYPHFSRDIHVIKPFKIPKHWPVGIALDQGVRHPFGASFGAKDELDNLFIFAEICEQAKTVRYHARTILEILDAWVPHVIDHSKLDWIFEGPNKGPHHDCRRDVVEVEACVIDPSAQQTKLDLEDYGICPTDAKRDVLGGINSVAELIQLSKSGQNGGIYIFENCEAHIEQFATYSWEEKGERPMKIGDDCMDTTRYLVSEEMQAATQDLSHPDNLQVYELMDRIGGEKPMGYEHLEAAEFQDQLKEWIIGKGF